MDTWGYANALGRVGTACQPRSSPQGELGRGKALPCTPAEEGAAKPRPTLNRQLGWHAVPTLPEAVPTLPNAERSGAKPRLAHKSEQFNRS